MQEGQNATTLVSADAQSAWLMACAKILGLLKLIRLCNAIFHYEVC